MLFDGRGVFMKRFIRLCIIVILLFPIIWIKNDDSYQFVRKNSFLFVLSIPKINLIHGIYSIHHIYNQVDYNIELLSDSSLYRRLFFLAGHSGNGENCFFNHLIDLEYGDKIYLDFYDNILVYEVIDIYYIIKDGTMDVDMSFDTLYLITCSLIYPDRQLIVKCKIVE